MDGTLIDSSHVIANSINFVRSKLSLEPMPVNQIVRCVNNVNIHAPSFFYGSQEFTKEQIDWFQEYYTKNHQRDTRLYDGMQTLLERLVQEKGLSVATNAYTQSALQILQSTGIEKHFDIILCADQVTQPKPHPEMIEKIVSHYRGDVDEFVLVGDGERDIMAAQNAGMDTILVDWGFSDHKDKKAVESVQKLADLLL